jgi:hypothetical protein
MLDSIAMASVRLETCSLERILLMWALTVAMLMTRASAICWLLLTLHNQLQNSLSRSVRSNPGPCFVGRVA